MTRYELRNPKKICWSQLPIHAAIVFGGPPRLIELLVKIYPRGCRCTDDQSMLPVHLALRFGASDAILWNLLKEFPVRSFLKQSMLKIQKEDIRCNMTHSLSSNHYDRLVFGILLELFLTGIRKTLIISVNKKLDMDVFLCWLLSVTW